MIYAKFRLPVLPQVFFALCFIPSVPLYQKMPIIQTKSSIRPITQPVLVIFYNSFYTSPLLSKQMTDISYIFIIVVLIYNKTVINFR